MIDNLTGLVWPKNGNLPNDTKTWNDAIDYANNLTLCGHDDWHLPNINELESLVNAGQADSATWLNTQGFSDVQSFYYWSSTTYADYTGYAWYVSMWNGGVGGYDKTGSFYVWPVRLGQSGSFDYSAIWRTGQTTSYRAGDDGGLKQGVSWPSPRFGDQGNGEVTDNLTGLAWTKDANAPGPSACSPAVTKTWQGALDYVKCLNAQNYLGYTYWRLPNRKELRGLSDYSRYDTALPSGHPFTNVQSNYYWSSTTGASSTGQAWIVNMWHGSVFGYNKTNSRYVWPVRSGQGGSLSIPLTSGWNLISVPIQPTNTAIATVLNAISGSYTIVWAYMNGGWKLYDPSDMPGGTLTTMEAGTGYWIKMGSDKTLAISGTTASTSISLVSGWNLTGYNKTVSANASDVLTSIANKYTVVWAYINGVWKLYDPSDVPGSTLTEFLPNYGYWIKTTQAVTWTQ